MKTFLKELTKIVKDIKPKAECAYLPFEEIRCKTCHRYKECLDINKHHQRCNKILKDLDNANIIMCKLK